MEFESAGCRDGLTTVVLVVIAICLIGAVVVTIKWDSNRTIRAEAKARAEENVAMLRFETEKAQLTAELDKMRLAEANHEQRIATLAVALAGLNDADSAALMGLLDAQTKEPKDWLDALVWFLGGCCLTVGLLWVASVVAPSWHKLTWWERE